MMEKRKQKSLLGEDRGEQQIKDDSSMNDQEIDAIT